MYIVYLVKYKGDKLPPYYIGSTSLKKIKNGYRGSIKSRKYKNIFKDELKNNLHLFEYEILGEYESRKDALKNELKKQKELNVVKSDLYFNESFASVNGMFGRDVKGKNNPMYGKKNEIIAINVLTNKKIRVSKEIFKSNINLSGHTLGMLTVLLRKTGEKIRINKKDYNNKIHLQHNKGKKVSNKTKLKLSKMRKGYITAKDWDGKFHRVHKNDKRFKSGEFGNTTSKRWIITDLKGNKFKTFNFIKFFTDNRLQRPQKHNINIDGIINFSGKPYKLISTNGWIVKCLD